MTKVEETLEQIAERLEDLFGLYSQLADRQAEFERRVGELLTGVGKHLDTVEASLDDHATRIRETAKSLDEAETHILQLQEVREATTGALPKIYERVSSLGHKAEVSGSAEKTTNDAPQQVEPAASTEAPEATKALDGEEAESPDGTGAASDQSLTETDQSLTAKRGVLASVYGG